MRLSQLWPKTEKRSFKLINDRLSLQAGIKPPWEVKLNYLRLEGEGFVNLAEAN